MSGAIREKPRISLPVIVEGKYDKNRLLTIYDAAVFTTDGFSVFNSKEKKALFARLASAGGIILLTDSDGAGTVIRRCITSFIPQDKIYHLHIPRIPGKERRKRKPSAENILGVEGMDDATLQSLLAPFLGDTVPSRAGIRKSDMFSLGLSGAPESVARRDALAALFGLPAGMTCNALLAALNILTDADGFYAAANKITGDTP